MKLLKTIWDPNFIRRNTILQILLASLAFVLMVRIWPCGLVRNHEYSRQESGGVWQEETFSESDKKLQTVTFTQEHIYRMTMYLSVQAYADGDMVWFRLYDDSFSCIYEEKYACSGIERDGYLRATPDLDVTPGQAYYYEVLVQAESGVVLVVPTADNALLSQEENGALYIDGIINTDISLVADFDYSSALSPLAVILYDFLILAATFLAYVGILLLLEKAQPYADAIVKYGRWAATALVAVAAVVLFVLTVVRNVFGGETADRVVYALGIASGVFWLLCALWLPREQRRPSKLSADRQVSLIWRNYLQTVCFGFLFYALCQYVNADREYYHTTNTRWMLIFLGLAFLLIQSEKELLLVPSGVWLVASLAGSWYYCIGFTDEQELYLAKLTAAVVVVWGLVLLNALPRCKKEAFLRIRKPFFLLWLAMALLMYHFRYEKTWPFTATLPFLVLLLYQLSAAQRSRLLKNFVNGILFSFGLVVLFSLHHRPYHFWMLYRYSMMFHTVACTGMYLSVVFAAVLAKLYGMWSGSDSWVKKAPRELFLCSTVVVFLVLTMSRTAALTATVNLLVIVGTCAFLYHKSLRRVAKECVVLLGAVLISFPLVFSAVRMIPAVAHDVVIYDLETQDDSYTIYSTDTIDSGKYMSVERFFRLLFFRFDVFQTKETEAKESQQDLLVYIGHESLPIAAEQEERNYVLSDDSDVSNGRFTIFMDYLQGLNMTGHESMESDVAEHGHAHNSYLQIAHDFGIPAGIVFLLICVYTLIESVRFYLKNGRKYHIFLVPLSLTVSFGVMSLTEWASHPCIPAGFAFLFVQMLLMQKPENDD